MTCYTPSRSAQRRVGYAEGSLGPRTAPAIPLLFTRELIPADCTGPNAVWCPNCGDCKCEYDDDNYSIFSGTPLITDEACGLHGPYSPDWHGNENTLLYMSPVWVAIAHLNGW